MDDMEIFYEIQFGLPRQGPGSDEMTRRALGLLPPFNASSKILDVGCGPGKQTVALARNTPATIVALDNYMPFLGQLRYHAEAEKVADRIDIVCASMFNMNFKPESFDAIWSEGAIYIAGFKNGLRDWQRFLKPGGYMALTHITWLDNNPPDELWRFWQEGYPEIAALRENSTTIAECGYRLIDTFTLPESTWWNEYYTPLERKLPYFRDRYAENPAALAIVESAQHEIDIYKKYSRYYGYVFYVMQKA